MRWWMGSGGPNSGNLPGKIDMGDFSSSGGKDAVTLGLVGLIP
ncbi:MAG: hypothetical protein ACMUIA_09520 [bacterium]